LFLTDESILKIISQVFCKMALNSVEREFSNSKMTVIIKITFIIKMRPKSILTTANPSSFVFLLPLWSVQPAISTLNPHLHAAAAAATRRKIGKWHVYEHQDENEEFLSLPLSRSLLLISSPERRHKKVCTHTHNHYVVCACAIAYIFM
jgi:hypothetical protein